MSKDGNNKVRAEDLPYRPCVGIMVLNAKGLVWAGRRISEGNSEYDGSPQLWQMPQGGIDPGEDPETASLRELYEETGMKSVSLLAEASRWINYDLPDVAETYIHRIGRTGRAGLGGTAISFCNIDHVDNLRAIEKMTGLKIPVKESQWPMQVFEKTVKQQRPPRTDKQMTRGNRFSGPAKQKQRNTER